MRTGLIAVLLGFVCCATGCGRTVTITTQPDWPTEDYYRLGVAPTRLDPASDAATEAAARRLTDRLTTLFQANESFRVVTADELRSALGKDAVAAVVQEGGRALERADWPSTVDALVGVELLECTLDTEQAEERVAVFDRDDSGRIRRDDAGRPIVLQQRRQPVQHFQARIAAHAVVWDARTGDVLTSYESPVILHDARRAPPAAARAGKALLTAAARELARELYVNIAPLREEATFDSDMLVTALPWQVARASRMVDLDETVGVESARDYVITDEFPPHVADILVVVRDPPPACERIACRLVISRDSDGAAPLYEQEFVWSSATGAAGLRFYVPADALPGGPDSEFVASLYVDAVERAVLQREFSFEWDDHIPYDAGTVDANGGDEGDDDAWDDHEGERSHRHD